MKEVQECHEKSIETVNQKLDKLGSDVHELATFPRDLPGTPTKEKGEGGVGNGDGRSILPRPTLPPNDGVNRRSLHADHRFQIRFPAYNGEGAPDRWLRRCGQYCSLAEIESDDEKFQLVGLHLEGEALDWFSGYKEAGRLCSWEQFEADVADRFGVSEAALTCRGSLFTLPQATTADGFRGDFDSLSGQCTGLRKVSPLLNEEIQIRDIDSTVPYQNDGAQHRNPFISSTTDVENNRNPFLSSRSSNNYNDEDTNINADDNTTAATFSRRGLRRKGTSKTGCNEDKVIDSQDQEEHHRNPFLSSSSNGNNKMVAPLSTLPCRKQVSRVHWNEDLRMGEVIEQKGQNWPTTGIVRRGKLYCFIEEILFLAERGLLILIDVTDNVLNLGDIYKKLADGRNGCSWESYLAYKRLKSLGYVVGRHAVAWTLKHDKECNSLGMQAKDFNGDRKSSIPKEGSKLSTCVVRQLDGMHITELKLDFDVYLPDSKFKKSSPGDPFCVLCIIRGNPPTKEEREEVKRITEGVPLKFCHVDNWLVNFFSCDKVELPILP